MRGWLACALSVLATTAGCGGSSTPPGPGGPMPRSAAAFADSVGVNVHASYYDTAYGDWPRVLEALGRIGITHVRDGLAANPAPEWRDWNVRLHRAFTDAAARGVRFTFIMGRPGGDMGTPEQLAAAAAGPLRGATEALEGPNELNQVDPGRWKSLLPEYQQRVYDAVRGEEALRGVPVIGPSLVGHAGFQIGRLDGALDAGNMHPYTGGDPPTRAHVEDEIEAARAVSGDKPVVATEAGFHNAMAATQGQPPVPEDVAAAYTLRTLLTHFAAGVPRTFLYELADEKPDPRAVDPEQHFGLVRRDFSPKPAAVALGRLMRLLGERRPPATLTPLPHRTEGDDVRELLLQRRDGDHLLVLWRDGVSAWDPQRRRRQSPQPARVRVTLERPASVTAYEPTASADGRPVELAGTTAAVDVGVAPVVLRIVSR